MAITITLPDEIERQLQQKGQEQQLSVEALALEILAYALKKRELTPTPEDVVAKIQASSLTPSNIRPAHGSLADALRNAPEDPDFNLEAWSREWAAIEAEMRTLTLANTIAEGRG